MRKFPLLPQLCKKKHCIKRWTRQRKEATVPSFLWRMIIYSSDKCQPNEVREVLEALKITLCGRWAYMFDITKCLRVTSWRMLSLFNSVPHTHRDLSFILPRTAAFDHYEIINSYYISLLIIKSDIDRHL